MNIGHFRLKHSLRYRLRRAFQRLLRLGRFTLLAALSFVLVYPLLYMVSNAFKPFMQTYDPAVIWLPKALTLENLIDAMQILDIGNAALNTLQTAVVTSFIQVAACMLVGYGFARFEFRAKNVLFTLVVLTMIVPQQTISTSLYTTYRYFDPFRLMSLLHWVTGGLVGDHINLIDKPWLFWLPALLGMGLRGGVYIFVYRQFFLSMPKELEEAAEIDGCNPVRTFLHVMLPNAGTVVLTVLLFALVWNWNDYYTPAMFMKNHLTLATALSSFQQNLQNLSAIGGNYTDSALIATRMQAAGLLVISPLLVLYAFTQRFFIQSVERTGLTGM
ncbi:MAG: carbohydrate ABC transporter permease [Christensenellales bacterium]